MLTAIADLVLDCLFPQDAEQEHALRVFRSVPITFGTSHLRTIGLNSLDSVVAVGSYHENPVLKRAICAYKYARVSKLADSLSALMLRAIDGTGQPVVCAVPLHWTREFWRGFNQSTLLAQQICNARSWQHAHLLKRSRPTGHQAHRSKIERTRALRTVFRYCGTTPPPEHVLLVDDLFTTGHTLNECAKALKAAGVDRVDAAVIAYS